MKKKKNSSSIILEFVQVGDRDFNGSQFSS